MIILVDNGHGSDTRGKCSPDGVLLQEWKYTRKIARLLVSALVADGYNARLLVPEDSDVSLTVRCRRVNTLCTLHGSKNVILVSIHVNAASNGQWSTARGWEAYTSPGVTRADDLASELYMAATNCLPEGTKIRSDFSDGDSDKESDFYILKYTKCPAVLTENLFMDNRQDVDYLLSDSGMSAIVKLHYDGITNFING